MDAFKMPVPVKIMGRSSSITNSFVNGIIPCIKPSNEEIDEALRILDMDRESICCAYCGDSYTEWDHLNPLVVDKLPTGYISEIHNLVPSCGKCNQSKGNKNWREWILSSASLSPKSRGISDLNSRIHCLEEYEKLFEPIKIDFREIVDDDLWREHWANYESIIASMKEAQITSDKIKNIIRREIDVTYSRMNQKQMRFGHDHLSAKEILSIKLVPDNPHDFSDMFQESGFAIIRINYDDGSYEEKKWEKRNFSRTSNVIGNLRSRPEFRQGEWQKRGISSVLVYAPSAKRV